MAESVVFTLAFKVLSTIASPAFEMAYEKGVSIWEAREELDKLRVSMETIHAVLLDAEKKQEDSLAVKNWIKRLKGVFYDADDLFDEFATEHLLKQQMMEGKSKLSLKNKVRVFCSKLNPIVSRNSIAKKVKAIRKKLAEISIDMTQFVRCSIEKPMYNMGRGEDRGCFVDAKSVIGRDADKKIIMEMISNESDSARSDNPLVLAIVGIGGMGKTTLAQLIFNDEKITKTFKNRWFACISDISDEREVLGKIFKSIRGESYTDLSVGQLQTKIRESVENQNCLLVLDDVWEEDRARWQDRLRLMSRLAKESRIIVTTRSPSVAKAVGALKPHNLEGLSEDDAWSLFKELAFVEEYENDPRWESLGRKILKKCSGVPLAIRSIGSLLYLKNTSVEWEAIANEDLPVLQREHNDEILRVLKLSYDHLPSNLKQCFTYCCMFPKDYKYTREELVYQWISQGYINFDEKKSSFMHLFRMGFFQEAEEDESGEIESCKMHDLMHDLALHLIGEEGEFGKSLNVSSCTRHVSLILDDTEGGSWNIPPSLLNVKSIRSFMLLPISYLHGQPNLDQLCSHFKLLRTLTLSSLSIEHIPPSIGELKLMRYLDLSWNNFEELPDSFTNLVNLLVLDLEGCKNLKVWPRNFKNLIKLRVLKFSKKILSMPEGITDMDNLQYLSYFRVQNWSEFDGLNKLLERVRGSLFIIFDEEMKVEDEGMWQLPANISLQALKIVSYPGHGIRGFPGEALAFLKKLRIKRCSRLTSLHLASPRLLKIYIDECHELMSIELDQILSLRSLKIKNCKQLLSLQIEAHLFAGLEKIEIEECPELTMRLLNIQDNKLSMLSLKSIFVTNCKWATSLRIVELTCLRKCWLLHTVGLQSLHIPSSHLQWITLFNCEGLKSVEVEVATDITIKYCYELKNFRIAQPAAVQILSITSPSSVDWGSISNLLECSYLTEIKFEGVDGGFIERLLSSSSPSLQDGEMSIFNNTGSLTVEFTSLEQFSISDVHGLNTLIIKSPHLKDIYISICKKLTSVELESPIAHSDGCVFIGWCDQLRNVSIPFPIALQTLKIVECPELSLKTDVDWDSLPDLNCLVLCPLPPQEEIPQYLLQRQALDHLEITDSLLRL